MKRKVLPILLFFCLTAPVAVIFTFLQIQIIQVREEVREKILAGMDKNELILLKFTETEKPDDLKGNSPQEFEFNGEMYDIVAMEVKGDTTYYWCWRDDEETKLNQQLDELVAETLGNNSGFVDNKNQLLQFFKALYLTESGQGLIFIPKIISSLSFGFQEMFSSFYSSPPIPPP